MAEALSRNVSLSNGTSTGIVEAFKAAAAICPLPPAIELIGEKWTILIVRGSMSGLRHFEEFQASLGIARNILSDRLGKLVGGGILQRSPDGADRRKVVYTLTDKGRDLLPTLIALRQWSETWVTGTQGMMLVDRLSAQPPRKIVVQTPDGRIVEPEDLTWVAAMPEQQQRPVGRTVADATVTANDYS